MIDTDPQSLIAIATPPSEPHNLPDQQLAPQRKRGRKPVQIPDEIRQEILRLHGFYSARQISPRVGLSRKLVGRVLEQHGLSCCPQRPPQSPEAIIDSSKLDPFRELIAQRVRKRLTTTRILREIRQFGYQGGAHDPGQLREGASHPADDRAQAVRPTPV